MKGTLKLVLLLFISLSLIGCDSSDDVDTSGGSDVDSSSYSATDDSSTDDSTSSDSSDDSGEETGTYWGRHNGDRPTWYFSKKMKNYPKTIYLTITGCTSDLEVSNNGSRWESSGYILKQSDVSGRGMAAIGPSSCSSKDAYITY